MLLSGIEESTCCVNKPIGTTAINSEFFRLQSCPSETFCTPFWPSPFVGKEHIEDRQQPINSSNKLKSFGLHGFSIRCGLKAQEERSFSFAIGAG